MNGWIKCSERMPEDKDPEQSVDVLVFLDGVIYQAFYAKDDEAWYDMDGDELVDDLSEGPKYWRPLLERPHG